MKRSTDRILTTHTGSLPLPPLVRQALAAKRRGEAYDQAVIDATLTTAIGEVVRRQIEVGVDIVDDATRLARWANAQSQTEMSLLSCREKKKGQPEILNSAEKPS